jgi:cob(I)alamin adenosyltransferase
MGNRLTKVYTRTGDQGSTGLADGSRRSKNDPRVHCMGEVDELNACLGLALSLLDDGPLQQLLFSVQHDLFDVGAELCQPGKQLITLEKSADEFNARLDELREFILPGGSQAVASLHLARTVCRRVWVRTKSSIQSPAVISTGYPIYCLSWREPNRSPRMVARFTGIRSTRG